MKYIEYILTSVVEISHMIGFNLITDIHQEWFDLFFSDTQEITLQASRNSYKSTLLSIFTACYMIIFPNKRILVIRKTDDDISDFIGTVKNILESDTFKYLVLKIWGIELKIINFNSCEITTNLKTNVDDAAQLRGKSLNSALTGKHADLIITDDIVTLTDRISRADREKTKIKYQELFNLLNRSGKVINCGTPWHKDDCFSLMNNLHVYDCYKLEKAGVMTKELIKEKRSKMTSSLFAANYELKHIANEDAIFTNPQFTDNEKLIYNGICHIDARYSGSDYTAFTIIKKAEDKFYVLGKRFDKHVDDCLNEIFLLQKKYLGGKIYCENNGDKGYLKKKIIEMGNYADDYHESMNKYIKIISYLKPNWDNVIFLEDTDKDYINDILEYTDTAEHDDCSDSLASSIRIITTNRSPKVCMKLIGL
nr:MAG TPA: Terminase large subunit [Caudoviricetes sp.]